MNQNYAESRIIDAVVFIDGVEVPYSALQVTFAMNRPSSATILIEPDEVIDTWRPKSWVHIFIRDPFEKRSPQNQPKAGFVRTRDENFDQQTLMLYWEGEVVAINDAESAESRSTSILCMDLFAIPSTVSVEMVNIGAGLQVPVVNGSTFFGGLLSDDGSAATMVMDFFTTALFGDDKNKVPPVTPDRIARAMLEYFGGFNAAFGVQLVRTGFLQKIVGISDKAADLFVKQMLMREFIQGAQQTQPSSTVMDFVQSGALDKFMYHYVTVPLPRAAQVVRENLIGEVPRLIGDPIKLTKEENVSTYNSFVFLPNLYYAIPPFCNWLFPDQYNLRSVSRSFMQEPTRLGLQSSAMFVIGQFTHLAPSSLDSYFKQTGASTGDESMKKPGRLFGTKDTHELTGFSASELDLNNRGLGEELLKFLQPEEYEKGVLYQQDQNAYQELLNCAALFNKEFETAVANQTNQDSKRAAAEFYKKQVDSGAAYPNYMNQLAQYMLLLRKNSRTIEVGGPFNPWPVVGLPMMVLRQGRSYRGLLTELQTAIDYGGRATTNYKLDMAFLVRVAQVKTADDYAAAVAAYQEIARTVTDVADTLTNIAIDDAVFLSEKERESFGDLPSTDRLVVLEQKREDLEKRKQAVDLFMQQYFPLRLQASQVKAAPYMDTYFSGLMEYVGFFGSAVGAATGAADIRTGYGHGRVLGSGFGGLRDLLNTALKEQPSKTSSAAIVHIYDSLLLALQTFSESALAVARNASGARPGSILSFNSNVAVQAKLGSASTWPVYRPDWQRFLIDLINKFEGQNFTGEITLKFDPEISTEGTAFWLTFNMARLFPASSVTYQLYTVFARSLSDYTTKTGDLSPLLAFARLDGFEKTVEDYLARTEVALDTGLDAALTKLSSAVNKATQAYAAAQQFTTGSANEIPPVTSFVNASLLDVRQIDEALREVVRPARTRRSGDIEAPGTYQARLGVIGASVDEIVKVAESLQLDPARSSSLAYDEFVSLANQVFPLSATTDSTNPTEWERAKNAGKAHEWANNVQARKGVTLGEFMQINGLRLQVVTVQTPLGSSQFYQLVDETTTGDELAKSGARSFFSKFGNKDSGALKAELDVIRQEATRVGARPDWRWTLAPARQALILSYARKHFAVGAFAGKR